MVRPVLIGVWSGLSGGLILGLSLKLIEKITNIKVYRLLLNVDFIPVIGSVVWPEFMEFVFHLLISLIIGVIYSLLPLTRIRPYLTAYLITLPTIPLFFLLITLSIGEIVSLNDRSGFWWWVVGHILYAFTLSYSYQRLSAKSNRN